MGSNLDGLNCDQIHELALVKKVDYNDAYEAYFVTQYNNEASSGKSQVELNISNSNQSENSIFNREYSPNRVEIVSFQQLEERILMLRSSTRIYKEELNSGWWNSLSKLWRKEGTRQGYVQLVKVAVPPPPAIIAESGVPPVTEASQSASGVPVAPSSEEGVNTQSEFSPKQQKLIDACVDKAYADTRSAPGQEDALIRSDVAEEMARNCEAEFGKK
jgi:hypothetical protein